MNEFLPFVLSRVPLFSNVTTVNEHSMLYQTSDDKSDKNKDVFPVHEANAVCDKQRKWIQYYKSGEK